MAASITFPMAFFSSDRVWAVSLPRRAVHLPGCLPPRRWLAAAASRVAAEAAPDASGKRRPRGITKSRPVSPELQAVVGEAEIPRTQALKKIWAYIKENNLQVSPFFFLYGFDHIEETWIVCYIFLLFHDWFGQHLNTELKDWGVWFMLL